MLFRIGGCLAHSQSLILLYFNDREPFLYKVLPQFIELSLLPVTLDVPSLWAYFLIGTKLVLSTHCLKHKVVVWTKTIDTQAVFFYCSQIYTSFQFRILLLVIKGSVWAIFSNLWVFCRAAGLLVYRLRFRSVLIPVSTVWNTGGNICLASELKISIISLIFGKKLQLTTAISAKTTDGPSKTKFWILPKAFIFFYKDIQVCAVYRFRTLLVQFFNVQPKCNMSKILHNLCCVEKHSLYALPAIFRQHIFVIPAWKTLSDLLEGTSNCFCILFRYSLTFYGSQSE